MQILVSISLSAVAQMTLKVGMSDATIQQLLAQKDYPNALLAVFTNWPVLLGLFLYGVGTIIWLLVLAKADLSYAYPFVSLGFIITLALGFFVLHESVTLTRLAGTLLVMLGVFMISRT
ncbi:MAG: EamA family transporter [Pseudomonadota bacterium]